MSTSWQFLGSSEKNSNILFLHYGQKEVQKNIYPVY